ncbi:MAG: hypothetical protein KDC67_05235, partial [Ignavibacteriae bacterium]|nr:hypothetical protein [Ignavibacteriota bacterium]
MKNIILIIYFTLSLPLVCQSFSWENINHTKAHLKQSKKRAESFNRKIDSNNFQKIRSSENRIKLYKSNAIDGFKYEYTISEWDETTSTWKNSERFTNIYDDNQNEIESLYQIWDDVNNEWVNVEIFKSEYDANGNWLSYMNQEW